MIKATDEGLNVDKRIVIGIGIVSLLFVLAIVFTSLVSTFGLFGALGAVGYPSVIVACLLVVFFCFRNGNSSMLDMEDALSQLAGGETADEISARLKRERRGEDGVYMQVWTDAYDYLTAMDEYRYWEGVLSGVCTCPTCSREGTREDCGIYLTELKAGTMVIDREWVTGMGKRQSIERKYGYTDVSFDSLLMRKDKAYAIAE